MESVEHLERHISNNRDSRCGERPDRSGTSFGRAASHSRVSRIVSLKGRSFSPALIAFAQLTVASQPLPGAQSGNSAHRENPGPVFAHSEITKSSSTHIKELSLPLSA